MLAALRSMRTALAPFRHAWPHWRRQRRAFLFGGLALLVAQGLDLAIPLFWRRGIDGVTADLATAGSTMPPNRIALLAAAAVAVGLVSAVLKYVLRRQMVGASRELERDLRDALHAKLLTLPPTWHSAQQVGDLTSRFSQDLEAVRMALGPALMYVGTALVTLVGALIGLLWLDPALTLWMALPLLLLITIAARMAPNLGKASDVVQQGIGAISANATESFSAIRVLKLFCGEERRGGRMGELAKDYFGSQMKLAGARGGMVALLSLVKDATQFVILLAGGWHVLEKRASIGDLFVYREWILACFWPMVMFGWIVALVQRAAAGMRRLAAIFETESVLRVAAAPRRSGESGGPLLEVDGVTLIRDGRKLLDGLSLTLARGERLGITGPTGAGKSLLLGLLPRLADPDSGHVRFAGVDVREWELGALRRRVALVPQESFLFGRSLRDNLRFAQRDASDDAIGAVAQQVRFDDEIAALPAGLDTKLGERGVTLSGGQRQRAALARALLTAPELLLLDDALSAVDAETEAAIEETLRQRTGAMIVVSHRVAALAPLDRIVVLADGRVSESGSHAQLLARDGAYAKLARQQALVQELDAL